MLTLTATQFVNNFGQRNQEVQVEPIEVKSHGRTVGYYVSPNVFAQYEKLKAKMSKFHHIDAMPDEFWEAFNKRQAQKLASRQEEDDEEYEILFPGDTGYPAPK